jgi:hypothetical protein
MLKKMQKQRMPKQIATTAMEGTTKRGRPSKRRRDEHAEALNIM